jgi:hypothetical protein
LPTSPKVSAVLQELGHKLQKDIEDYPHVGYRSLLALLDFFLGNDIDKDDLQAANVLPPVGILLSFPVPSIRAKAVKLIDKWRIAMHLSLLDPMIAATTADRDEQLLSNPLPSLAQPNNDLVNAASNILWWIDKARSLEDTALLDGRRALDMLDMAPVSKKKP